MESGMRAATYIRLGAAKKRPLQFIALLSSSATHTQMGAQLSELFSPCLNAIWFTDEQARGGL